MRSSSSLRIEISSDLAAAAYFVMASWRDPTNAPCFDSADRPPALMIDRSPRVLRELLDTLRRIGSRSPALTNSVAAFIEAVERQRAPIFPASTQSLLSLRTLPVPPLCNN
jgi:hypothetical protein